MTEILSALAGLAILLMGFAGWTMRSEKKGEQKARGKQAEQSNETARRVADAQEDDRNTDIKQRRKRMFGDDSTK